MGTLTRKVNQRDHLLQRSQSHDSKRNAQSSDCNWLFRRSSHDLVWSSQHFAAEDSRLLSSERGQKTSRKIGSSVTTKRPGKTTPGEVGQDESGAMEVWPKMITNCDMSFTNLKNRNIVLPPFEN